MFKQWKSYGFANKINVPFWTSVSSLNAWWESFALWVLTSEPLDDNVVRAQLRARNALKSSGSAELLPVIVEKIFEFFFSLIFRVRRVRLSEWNFQKYCRKKNWIFLRRRLTSRYYKYRVQTQWMFLTLWFAG